MVGERRPGRDADILLVSCSLVHVSAQRIVRELIPAATTPLISDGPVSEFSKHSFRGGVGRE
jgi:hypothetical protein